MLAIRDMVGKRLRLVTRNSLRPLKGISPLWPITWRVTGISVSENVVYLMTTQSKRKETADWTAIREHITANRIEVV